MFLGPRLGSVFKSPRHALFWAGSVLLTAYCSIPAARQPPQSAPVAPAQPRVDPWAKPGAAR